MNTEKAIRGISLDEESPLIINLQEDKTINTCWNGKVYHNDKGQPFIYADGIPVILGYADGKVLEKIGRISDIPEYIKRKYRL